MLRVTELAFCCCAVTDMKRARACCESVLAFNRTPDRLALNHLKRIQEKNQQL
jgi:hypothetical protein